MRALRLLHHHLRSAGAGTVALALLLVLLASAANLSQQIETRAAQEDLEATLAGAPSFGRGLAVTRLLGGEPGNCFTCDFGERFPAPASMEDLARQTELRRVELAPALQDLVGTTDLVLDAPELGVLEPVIGSRPRFLRLRIQPSVDLSAALVAGRLPERSDEMASLDEQFIRPSFGFSDTEAEVLEVLLSRQSLDDMRLAIGDQVLVRRVSNPVPLTAAGGHVVAVRVVGEIDLGSGDEERWFGDARVQRPRIVLYGGGDIVEVTATAMVAPDDLDRIVRLWDPLPLIATWRHDVDPARADAADTGAVLAALERARQEQAPSEIPPAGGTSLRSSLATLVGDHQARRTVAARVPALGGGTAIGVGLVLVVALARARRRAGETARHRDRARGASGGQQTLLLLVEVVLVMVVGVLAALAVTAPAGGSRSPWPAVAAVAAAGLVVLVDGARATRTTPDGTGDGPRRRMLVEATAVVVATLLVLAARRGGTSPVLLATPFSAGIVGGLVARRAVQVVTTVAARWMSGGRASPGALVGMAGGARRTGSDVLAIGVATAVACGVVARAVLLGGHGTAAEGGLARGADLAASATTGAALVLGTLAVAAAVGLLHAARRRDLAILRALGGRARDDLTAVSAELLPAVVLATAGGLAAGATGAWALSATLDLSAVRGSRAPLPDVMAADVLLPCLAAVAAVSTAAVLLAVALARRTDPVRLLRQEETR